MTLAPDPSSDSSTSAGKVAIFGTGYVGLVTGACLASVGNRVTCFDVDESRIRTLESGRCPFHEPGLPEVVEGAVKAGQLDFTASLTTAVKDAGVIFLAVGTPQGEDGAADLTYLKRAMQACIASAEPGATVVVRSTVPPGTGDMLERMAREGDRADLQLVSAPEFLAEGTAVKDFMNPGRLVFGGSASATARVAALFATVKPEAPRIFTDRRTSELSKYAANTFLAARVSLINEFANLCDALGADVAVVSRVVGLDERVGPLFLRPGPGYGGSCFPKDVQAIRAVAQGAGVPVPVAEATEATNQRQWRAIVEKARLLAGGSLEGKTVGVLGLAFKPDTDDTRSSPALRIIQGLRDAGALVRAHDPIAKLPAGMAGAGVEQVATVEDALRDADVALLATEWAQYRELAWADLKPTMRQALVVDARNALPLDALAKAGFRVSAVGRRSPGVGA
jgi:UDPglucose 6-dehydrogenase